MTKLRGLSALVLGTLLTGVIVALPATADHEDDVYELPSIIMWNETKLSVLVVPPNHGQIWNEDKGFLNGMDPKELTPFNSYLTAIEDAIQAWDDALGQFGHYPIAEAYEALVYILGRDDVPPDVLVDPDILVVTDEAAAGALGSAVRTTNCLVQVAKQEIESFSYADMYNVTAQEFGHCLGLRHVGSQGGVDPTSDLKHPEHDVMNGFYTHWIGEAGTHLHCISNLDIMALEFALTYRNTSPLTTGGYSGITYLPAAAYGDTCSLPPNNWRSMGGGTVGGPKTQPSPEPEPKPQPEPQQNVRSQIDSPIHGSSLPRARFGRVSGTTSGTDADSSDTEVALARKVGEDSCAWWVADKNKFLRGSCDEPHWNLTDGGTEWELALGRVLKQGHYRAMSRAGWFEEEEPCCEQGRNLVEFWLT